MNKKYKFQDKIKKMFIKYTLIPIMILILVFCTSFLTFFYLNASNASKKASRETLMQLERIIISYDIGLEALVNNPDIQTFLQENTHQSSVYEAMYTFNAAQEIKSAFQLIGVNGKNISSMADDDLYPKLIPYNIKRKLEAEPTTMLIDSRYSKLKNFTVARAVLTPEAEVIGYVIFHLEDEDIQAMLAKFQTNALVITDDFDNVLATTQNNLKDVLGKIPIRMKTHEKVTIEDKKFYQHVAQSSNYNLKIYALTLRPNYRDFVGYLLLFFITLAIILYALIQYLARKLAKENAKSVNTLVASLEGLKSGDMHQKVTITSNDEFEYIAEKYNEMLIKLQQNIMDKEELTHIMQQNEIKFLQNQFNPHFLFNMLETIKYTMYDDLEKATEILINLAYLLRYSIGQGVQYETLKTDIDYTEKYLYLHHFRYKERLQYDISIEVQLQAVSIPKLLLQPLVENSIKYGYINKMNLLIKITVYEKNKLIYFDVYDNGGGISQDKLAFIRKGIEGDENVLTGIGLTLIDRKIKILYGEKYGLSIDTDSKTYTCVRIVIPKNEKGAT